MKSFENILQVFPNPVSVSSDLIIRSHLVQQADGNIIIFDSNGKLVRELKFGKTDRLQIKLQNRQVLILFY
ncbi:MAG: hypothetical protein IPJ13_10205 [Saprospiraceae bacterium]|nr:hypothetical protein [Saprospiraceae bacterium]